METLSTLVVHTCILTSLACIASLILFLTILMPPVPLCAILDAFYSRKGDAIDDMWMVVYHNYHTN